MKKYLMTGVAALALCATFTSCSHDIDSMSQEELSEYYAQKIVETYEKAFIENIGQPAADQDWGFGTTSVAGVRGGTRAVPGITFPDFFSEKTAISEPGTIQKPTINKSNANIVYTESQTVQSIDGDKTIYVESGVTLTIDNSYGVSLERVNIYLASGSSLVVPNSNFYLKGNSNMVNDGGTIIVGDENNKKDIVFENFTGTFWNNGTINYVNDFKTYNGEGGNIYLGSSSVLNATNLYLYKKVLLRNEGEITLTGEFNADQYEHKIYNSGTIITPSIILQKEVTLWNEGTIKAANDGRANISINNDDVKIYIGTSATLKLTSLELTNNRELVFNEGQLNVEGAIETYNNSEIVNNGTLAGGSLDMKSGAKFYNVAGGNVNIIGLTKLNNDSGYNTWQNSGQYYTGSFEITGGCQDPAAFNNCHMYVTGQFFMNHGNFVLDGGGAVECGSFKWESDNFFHMGGKALLKVTGQMLMNNQNSSPNYGFWGDDSEYAVIQAGSVEKASEGKYRAAYYGNLFIDTNDHFGQGRSSADGPWYYFADKVKFSFNDKNNHEEGAKKATDFSITIPADPNGCTPGYKYDDDEEEEEDDGGAIRVIAEDLTATTGNDFDFNDVVFDVTYGEANEAKITVRAAGGTLPLRIKVGAGNTEADYQEVHALWEQSTGIMINTDYDKKYTSRSVINMPAKDVTLGYAVKTPTDVRDLIKIEVQKTVNGQLAWIELKSEQGKPAAKIAVNPDWHWLNERVDITTIDGFVQYVTNRSTWVGSLPSK